MNRHKKSPVAPTTEDLYVKTFDGNHDMNSNTAVSNVIPFRSAKLLLVECNGQPFVPMKPVVDGMGLDWKSQHEKLNGGRFKSVMVIIPTTGSDGKTYEMSCLPLRKLPGWLMSIHASKVREDLRDNVIAYQNECDDVLWSYWNDGHATNHRDPGESMTLIGKTIGTDGFHMLGAVVKGKVAGLPRALQRRATSKIWSQTHAAFGVRSAEDIPADQLDSARNFIAAYTVLEGEFLGREDTPDSKVNWPATRWLAESAPKVRERMTTLQGAGNIMLTPDMLFGPVDCISPTLRAIAELEKQGHNLEACRLEVMAMKHHLEEAEYAFSGLRLWASRTQGKGIRFNMQRGAA